MVLGLVCVISRRAVRVERTQGVKGGGKVDHLDGLTA